MKDSDKITLSHGSGGKQTHELIREIFLKNFRNPFLKPLADSAVVKIGKEKLAFTTDSFVVSPIFFPGGDIGSLAVNGTVNDLSVMGAKPLVISCGMIIEEGFDKIMLVKIAKSMRSAAKRAGVEIVTGDTKVVERGAADRIFINTSGIGTIKKGIEFSTKKIRPGDSVMVTGTIGDHGAAIMSKRKGLEFETTVKSDCAPLNLLLKGLTPYLKQIRFMRDPTRGGVATTLNEVAQEIPYGIEIFESALPFRKETRALSEILGLDPLYFPNEGMAIIVCPEKNSAAVLNASRKNPLGRNSRVIGRITKEYKGKVLLKTALGPLRLLEMLSGEQLPRIC